MARHASLTLSLSVALVFSVIACGGPRATAGDEPVSGQAAASAATTTVAVDARGYPADPQTLTDQDWHRFLSPEQFHVLREQGTEPPFTGEYWDNHADGIYVCAACGQVLFRSGDKFESGTGWPSFTQAADGPALSTRTDGSRGMLRTEAVCSRCGGHLGHVFDDGPPPTGKRWCINSASLDFVPASTPMSEALSSGLSGH